MNKYTVLLVVPDYVAENYGQDQLVYRVTAYDSYQASLRAKHEAARDQSVNRPEDYYCAWIFEGHISPLCWGEPVGDHE